MKYVYLIGALILTVTMLVLGFGNVGSSCQQAYFFFSPLDNTIPATMLVFALGFIGILTGLLYAGFISKMMENTEDEDDSGM